MYFKLNSAFHSIAVDCKYIDGTFRCLFYCSPSLIIPISFSTVFTSSGNTQGAKLRSNFLEKLICTQAKR